MDKLDVMTPSRFYSIYFGSDVWKQVQRFAKAYDSVLVVSDAHVAPLYGQNLPYPISIIQPGEERKTLATIEALLGDWLKRGIQRRSLILALGGGVVGDLVGLAASLYQRGIAYAQIPTTLVAQVDSAVGGKTGVNTSQGKNLIGTFYQPWGVFIDVEVLQTLPPREITNGLGEVLKYGVIADATLFSATQNNLTAFYQLDSSVVGPMIRRCLELKATIVASDEQDIGGRKILNHGHTFGHAIEQATNYERHNHGEAVLLGMLLEARLAQRLGLLTPAGLGQIEAGLRRVELDFILGHLDRDDLLQALRYDKKNRQGKISFILPREIGRVEEVLLSLDEVKKHLSEVLAT